MVTGNPTDQHPLVNPTAAAADVGSTHGAPPGDSRLSRRGSALTGQRFTHASILDDERYSWLRSTHYLHGHTATKEKRMDTVLSLLRKERWIETSLVIIFLWLLSGTLFYHYSSKFTTAQAFYFAVQSGFSVGFGANGVTADEASDAEACRWYTIGHVLIGSSLIAAALGAWADALVRDTHKCNVEIRRLVRDQHLDMTDSMEVEDDERTLYCHLSGTQKALILLILLLIGGCVFGLVHEEWRFSEAALYAISALSTGGLISPTTDDTAMWFTGFYCLFGIPVYGYALAATAGWLQSRNRSAQLESTLQKGFKTKTAQLLRLELTRRRHCNNVLSNSDPRIDWAHFLELYLVRLELASDEDIKNIRAKFESMMNEQPSGPQPGLSITDVSVDVIFHEFVHKKVTGRDYLDFDAFCAMCIVILEDQNRFTLLDEAEYDHLSACGKLGSRVVLLKALESRVTMLQLYEHFASFGEPKCGTNHPFHRKNSRPAPIWMMERDDLYKFLLWFTCNLVHPACDVPFPQTPQSQTNRLPPRDMSFTETEV